MKTDNKEGIRVKRMLICASLSAMMLGVSGCGGSQNTNSNSNAAGDTAQVQQESSGTTSEQKENNTASDRNGNASGGTESKNDRVDETKVPGTYTAEAADVPGKLDIIELKADHTGRIEFQDILDITWDAEKISVSGGSEYTYIIEGDKLYLDDDGITREFKKTDSTASSGDSQNISDSGNSQSTSDSGNSVVPTDVEANYIGEYMDSDSNDPSLVIQKRSDGKYDVKLSIFRLASFDDGIGELITDGADSILFTATDPNESPIQFRVVSDGKTAKVAVVDSTWGLLENGTIFEYEKLTGDSGNSANSGSDLSSDEPVTLQNMIGTYQCDRASIMISSDSDDTANIDITWGGSAFESAVWTMTGSFDASASALTYKNGVRRNVVYNDDGSEKSSETVYEDGTGTFFYDSAKNTLTWQDDKENMADGMVFERINLNGTVTR